MNQEFETVTVEFRMVGRTGAELVFNSNHRHGVTPPEYKMLQKFHGKDNVQIADITGPAREFDGFIADPENSEKQIRKYRPRTEQEERDRLRSWYGAQFDTIFNETQDLPFTFEEIRVHLKKKPAEVRKINTKRVESGSQSSGGSSETQGEAGKAGSA